MDLSDLVLRTPGNDPATGSYAQTAIKTTRLKKVLLSINACPFKTCTPRVADLSVADVFGVVRSFWSLEPATLNVILHSMYIAATDSGKRAKVKWCIGQTATLCFRMMVKLFGTSARTLRSYISGSWSPKVHGCGRPREAGMLVDFSSHRCTHLQQNPLAVTTWRRTGSLFVQLVPHNRFNHSRACHISNSEFKPTLRISIV